MKGDAVRNVRIFLGSIVTGLINAETTTRLIAIRLALATFLVVGCLIASIKITAPFWEARGNDFVGFAVTTAVLLLFGFSLMFVAYGMPRKK